MLSVQQHYQIAKAHRFIGTPLSTIRGNVIVQNEHSNDSNSSSCNDSVKDNPMSSAQKRKLYGSTLPQQQSSVARRNARERNRVKQVNNGFATLRQHIPDALATYYASSANAGGNNAADGNGSGSSSASGSKSNSKKLSKVEILRIALKYIEGMKSMIDEHDAEAMSQTSSSASPLPNNIMQTLDNAGMTVDMNFELKSESDDESYAHVQTHYDQYVHQDQYQMIQQQQPQLQQQVQQQQQVAYINSNSPTPSFTSETSSTGGSQGYGQGSYHTMNSLNLQTQVSFDSAPFMSSEEKDILHFINQWQNDNQHHQQQQQQQQQLLHA